MSWGRTPVAGGVEGGVDPGGREGADSVGHPVAVADRLGAEQADAVMVGGAGGADDARAAGNGELDRCAADPAGGSVDEQRGPAGHAELVKGAGCGLHRDREPGGIDEPERRRDDRAVGQQGQLGRARVVVGDAENAVPDGDVGHPFPYLVDHARDVAAGRLRELRAERHRARTQFPVGPADAGRADRDPDLAGTGMRVGQVYDPQDLGASVLVELCCFHDVSSRVDVERRSEGGDGFGVRVDGQRAAAEQDGCQRGAGQEHRRCDPEDEAVTRDGRVGDSGSLSARFSV
jgi:hypothetical protein